MQSSNITDTGEKINHSRGYQYARGAGKTAHPITQQQSDDIDRLSAVIKKAPKWHGGTLYRGVTYTSSELAETLAKLDRGENALPGFNSTTISQTVAREYAEAAKSRNPGKKTVIFDVIDSKKGAFLGHRSYTAADQEVLFDRKQRFRTLKPGEKGYIKREKADDGFVHIAICEV